jgi:beta-lactamase class D
MASLDISEDEQKLLLFSITEQFLHFSVCALVIIGYAIPVITRAV